jgi:hypothetical protein
MLYDPDVSIQRLERIKSKNRILFRHYIIGPDQRKAHPVRILSLVLQFFYGLDSMLSFGPSENTLSGVFPGNIVSRR